MKVLSFKSEDIEITANTATDIVKCWRRFKARVRERAATYCDYSCTLPGILSIATPPTFTLHDIGESDSREWKEQPPVFYETATYNVSIYLNDIETAPCILHKLKEVTELFSVIKIGENTWLMTAPLSFVNEPGIFELTFKYKPRGKAERTDTFSFRVVSPKLDTKDDYNHLLAEINTHYNEIVFQYLTLTLQNLQRGGKSNNDVVWLSIFRKIAKDYEKWVRYIVNKPHLRQSRKVHFDRADRIKRWNPRMEEHYVEAEHDGRLKQEYFRHEETIHTNNTRENRFVKFTLDRIGKRMASIVATIKANDAQAKDADKVFPDEIAELEGYVSSLRRLANSKIFRNLREEPLSSESMMLQKRTGYTQVYKYWLLLQRGIELFNGATAIGVRPIWELYELWCFLKMRQMVADILGLHLNNPEEIIEHPMPMLKPFEDNNQEHTVEFNCSDGSKVFLYYQHTYNRRSGIVHTATTENRPDIVLNIVKDEVVLTYLFDAKYRLFDDNKLNNEDQEEYSETTGIDYPPSDAINQMHRYRDAIYYGSNDRTCTAKEIIGGYVLFPGRIKGVLKKDPYFIKSIKTVNIGAFPLLPNASDPSNKDTLLYNFLSEILNTPLPYDNIKDSIPQKGLLYEKDEKMLGEDILCIAGYANEKQLDAVRKNRIYYVRAGLRKGSLHLEPGFEKAKFAVLFRNDKTEDKIMFFLDGRGPRVVTGRDLKDKGFPDMENKLGNLYLAFDLEPEKENTVLINNTLNNPHIPKDAKDNNEPFFISFKHLFDKTIPSDIDSIIEK